MQRRFLPLCGLILVLAASPLLGDATSLPRIVPAGIDGQLLLCGRGDIADVALKRFMALAGAKNASVVLLDVGEPGRDEHSKRFIEDVKRAAGKVVMRRFESRDAADDEQRLAPLTTATAAWLLDNDAGKLWEICSGSGLEKELHKLLKRRGAVGASGAASEILARLGLLPDAVIQLVDPKQPVSPKVAANQVGYELHPGAALLVRGRYLEAVGTGAVYAQLAESPSRPAKRWALSGGVADLTLLRRAARERAASFPPAQPAAPLVEKGTLVIVGGGKTPPGLIKRFVDFAGGAKASIVLLPTANADPIPNPTALAASFRRYGAKVTVLPGRTQAAVESPESLEAIRHATGIWFGGGRQWRFVDAYEDTKAHELMHKVLERGGVIGGSSAGASIQAEYLARGSPYGSIYMTAEGYQRGLGFLGGVAIDQHFTQRRRQPQMSSLMKQFPQFLGIGIDEGTALIVRRHTAQVVGQGRAFFYDARRDVPKGAADYEAVPAGGAYDLQMRKVLPAK